MDGLVEFSDSLVRLADSLSDEGLEGVMTSLGVAAKGDFMAAAKHDLGGDNAMSGWKRAKLNSGFEHTGRGVITMEARPSGVWQVAEQGRSAGRKRAVRGKYKGRNVGWGNTSPKHTFTDALTDTEQETGKRLERAMDTLIGRVLNG